MSIFNLPAPWPYIITAVRGRNQVVLHRIGAAPAFRTAKRLRELGWDVTVTA